MVLFGSRNGRREAKVKAVTPGKPWVMKRHHPDEDRLVFTYKFPADKHFVIDQSRNPSGNGDSGSPVVWEDPHGNYRLVGVYFGSRRSFSGEVTEEGGVEKGEGGAVPALLAESLLQVKFGVQAPTAEAGDPITVNAGEMFCLDGSDSSVNEPNAGPLEYSWERYISTPRPTGPLVGPQVFTRDPTKEITAPSVPGEAYLYKLTVKDANGAKHSNLVRVIVNTPPIAKPGPNRVVPVHTPASLTPRGDPRRRSRGPRHRPC